MNLLKKQEGIEIHFYDEDNAKDSTSLRNSLEEFVDYFQNSSVNIKFLDLETLRLESLSLLLSFAKELKAKGNSCIWTCSDSLREQLKEFGITEIVQLN